jgi:hypothetical protein
MPKEATFSKRKDETELAPLKMMKQGWHLKENGIIEGFRSW